MAFNNEKEFEQHIRELIKLHIIPQSVDLLLLHNKKAVDVLICRNGIHPAAFFIEIKYHRKDRLGTGHGNGGGFQPEIIKCQPSYFESNMRWILGDVRYDNSYWFVDNATIGQYLAGDAIEDKYNNIRVKIFKEQPKLTEEQLISVLLKWLIPHKR